MIEGVAALIVRGTIPDREIGDAVLGDLLEEHAEVAVARGRFAADGWLAWQLVRSFPYFHQVGRRAPATLRDTGAFAVRFYRGALLVNALGLGGGLVIVRAWRDWPAPLVVAFAVAIGFVAGHLAARLLPRAPLFVALAVGTIAAATAGSAMSSGAIVVSALRVAALPCLALAAIGGGLVRVRALLPAS